MARLEAAMAMLREMGFGDEALNRDVLTACGYDEQRAVAALCELTLGVGAEE